MSFLSKCKQCAAMSLFIVFAVTAEAFEPKKYAAIVVNHNTGDILYAKNVDKTRHPASMTKVMTLYLLFEAIENGKLKLSDRLHVSKKSAIKPALKLGLKAGQGIRVKDAILSVVTYSANDVAHVIAENLSGSESEFALVMTQKAKALGMKDTNFVNASGLHHSKQVTTAYDMAILGRRMIEDFPQYYKYFNTKYFSYGKRKYKNHNKLLGKFTGIDGIKTGYVRKSGYNLMASAARQGNRLVAVVMGGKTSKERNKHMAELLDAGFDQISF